MTDEDYDQEEGQKEDQEEGQKEDHLDHQEDNNVQNKNIKHSKRGKHRKYRSFNAYTKKLLEHIRDNYRIRKDANDMFNVIIDRVSIALLTQSNNILMYANRTNMTDNDIQTAVVVEFPENLGNEAIKYANKAVYKYSNYKKDHDGPVSKHVKAGLVFPVSRFRTKISDNLIKGKQIGEPAAVFLAATLEYVVIQILEPSCEATASNRVITVNCCHIKSGIAKNADIQMLFKRVGLYFCNNQVINKTNSFKWRPKVPERVVGLESLSIKKLPEEKEKEKENKESVVDEEHSASDESAVQPVEV